MAQVGGAIPMIIQGIVTASSAYMSYQQGQETQAIAETNADIAEANAQALQYQADVNARNERKRSLRRLATQRMIFGKAGVTPEGTPLLVMEETAREGEKEALMMQWAGHTGVSRYRSKADIYNMQGSSAATAGTWGAGITMGKGLLTMADNYPETATAVNFYPDNDF